jgi:hypothetical protein
MDAFVTAFWPNAAATIVGVVLGLPVALWINRLALKNTERGAHRAQVQRLDHALQVLISAMESNQSLLAEYANVLSESKVSWRLNLDVSAWDAIKADIVAELTDPDLRRQLAFHFMKLNALRDLNQEYLGFAFGTNASMSGSEKVRESIKTNMKTMCEELQKHAVELVALCKTSRNSASQLKN